MRRAAELRDPLVDIFRRKINQDILIASLNQPSRGCEKGCRTSELDLLERAQESHSCEVEVLAHKVRLLCIELQRTSEGWTDAPVLLLGFYHRRWYLTRPGVHVDLMALALNGVEMKPGTQVKTATTRLHAHVPTTITEWFTRSEVSQSLKGLEV